VTSVRRPRPIACTVGSAVPALALVLAVAGCGGGKDDPPAAGASTGAPSTAEPGFSVSATPVSPTGAPLPRVRGSQVRSLVGTWVGKAPQRDYFVFKSDGSASWVARGDALWTGQVIPAGNDQFRLSWEGTDPQEASYWSVRLSDDGKSLTFGGTNQTYTKARS
jgi:hypothetical protein